MWQTLDVRERAWHATVANDASVGVEICNVGACECTADGNACAELPARLARWYEPVDAGGGRAGSESGAAKVSPGTKTIGGRAWRLLVPDGEVPALASLPHFEPPCDIAAVEGHVHGQRLVQMAFTRAQLRAVAALGAALSSALPGIVPAFPTADGATAPLWTQMPPEDLRVFRGLLGHFHVQTNKVRAAGARHMRALPACRRGEDANVHAARRACAPARPCAAGRPWTGFPMGERCRRVACVARCRN